MNVKNKKYGTIEERYMSTELTKRIKSSIKILFIVLFIIELPDIIQTIFQ